MEEPISAALAALHSSLLSPDQQSVTSQAGGAAGPLPEDRRKPAAVCTAQAQMLELISGIQDASRRQQKEVARRFQEERQLASERLAACEMGAARLREQLDNARAELREMDSRHMQQKHEINNIQHHMLAAYFAARLEDDNALLREPQ